MTVTVVSAMLMERAMIMEEMLVRAMMVMAVEIKMAMMVTERAVYGGDGEGDDVMVMALVAEIAEMGDGADSDCYDGNGDSGCDGEGDGVSATSSPGLFP